MNSANSAQEDNCLWLHQSSCLFVIPSVRVRSMLCLFSEINSIRIMTSFTAKSLHFLHEQSILSKGRLPSPDLPHSTALSLPRSGKKVISVIPQRDALFQRGLSTNSASDIFDRVHTVFSTRQKKVVGKKLGVETLRAGSVLTNRTSGGAERTV